MAWELREGSGSLFRNERKEKDSHPNYKGELMIDGTVYWISAWLKEGKRGKFLSLSAKPRPDKAPDVLPKVQGGIADMADDEIPF